MRGVQLEGYRQTVTVTMMNSEGVDFFSNPYYGHIRRLLSILAIWPFESSKKRLPYATLITIVLFMGISLQIFLMLISERTVNSITELLQTFLINFNFGAAYWNLLYNSVLLKKILERVRNDWNKLRCEDELSIMKTYAAQSKLYSQTIAWAFLLYSAFLVVPSIIRFFLYIFGVIDKTKLILPIHNEILMVTKLRYLATFSSEVIIVITLYLIGITNYSIIISLLQHACALFIIVTNKIYQPFVTNEYKFGHAQTVTKRKAEFQWIVGVVQSYDDAVDFVELIKLLYKQIYIMEVLIMLCSIIIDFIYFFQLLDMTITAGEALKMCMYIIASLLLIYAYMYLAERLIDHSTSVYEKCRLVPFYTLSIETNKLFLLLIMRSMKTYSISISGIIVASHELFANLIKASFSFATFCYNMH